MAFKRSNRFMTERRRLGRNVRLLRTKRAWTLEHAAERMQLDLKHLQKVEAGLLNVTLVTLVRIADGLDVEVCALFARAARQPRTR